MVDRPSVGSVFGGSDDDEDFEITGGSDGGNSSAPPKAAPAPRATPPKQTPPQARKPGVPSATPSTTGVPNPLSALKRPTSGTGSSLPSPAPRRVAPPTPTLTPSPARPSAGLPTKPTVPTPQQPSQPTAPVVAPETQQPAPVAAPPVTYSPEPVPVQPQPAAPQPITHQTIQQPAAQEELSYDAHVAEQEERWQEEPPMTSRRPRPRVEDQEDEDEEEETPRNRGRRRPAAKTPAKGRGKKGSSKKGSTKKDTSDKPPSSLTGGRKNVIFFRVALFGLMLLLAGLGAKSVIAPPSFPGPAAVVDRVKEGLGMTDFPVESGDGFVLGFSRAYLEFDPAERNERDITLQNYAPDAVLSNIRMAFAGSEPPAQTITAGPFLTGSRSIDDQNAVYTVSAQINGSNWVYVEVPLFYDPEERSFAVSGSPAFVGPPTQAEVPGQPLDGIPDDKVNAEVEERLQRFFGMWGSSDIAGLDTLLTPDADPRARYGLGGTVTFTNINTITILEAKPDTDPDIRNGRVQVVWGSPSSPETTYTQTYDIVIEKLDDGRWYVKDILGGVTSETGGGSTETEG